ncbi:hypothetical protein CXG81DRAFT_16311 [Caulochytrium protostelioides]|uniref:Glycosyltransferase 61 catalytic domain-containing protein n=1 Tax=Caulochytrium protostelioides TaxID=1555241 RepID=A0A4P9XFJ9_9FUNG|nr:hypothetical protein CXG81DRAFT_16311 [Caulochytrium protostelioides]|eukprot:RKP04344.1 hypothetical protein CXG81DRAFT_16311 [Caulochytrium protostelioides]
MAAPRTAAVNVSVPAAGRVVPKIGVGVVDRVRCTDGGAAKSHAGRGVVGDGVGAPGAHRPRTPSTPPGRRHGRSSIRLVLIGRLHTVYNLLPALYGPLARSVACFSDLDGRQWSSSPMFITRRSFPTRWGCSLALLVALTLLVHRSPPFLRPRPVASSLSDGLAATPPILADASLRTQWFWLRYYREAAHGPYYQRLEPADTTPVVPADRLVVEALQRGRAYYAALPTSHPLRHAPPHLAAKGKWDVLHRLTNLYDIAHASNHTGFRLVLGAPSDAAWQAYVASGALRRGSYASDAPPVPDRESVALADRAALEVVSAWHGALFLSEYPYMRDEGYRCLHDLRHVVGDGGLLRTPWAADTLPFHPPSLVYAAQVDITSRGYLRKQAGQLFLPSESCWAWHIGEWNDVPQRVFVDHVVLVITNYWMGNIFHVLIESMGRLAPYWDQIREIPDVVLHVPDTSPGSFAKRLLEFVGWPSNRLVTGTILAREVLLPESSWLCTLASPVQVWALQKLLVRSLAMPHHFPQDLAGPFANHIVLIRRGDGQKRRITNYDAMVAELKAAFPREAWVEFRDDPPPAIAETFHRFRHAKLVVGPHGAGMSNLIVCRAGTRVVELLTNDHYINTGFARLAQQLGLQYHGFAPATDSRYDGTITADIPTVVHAVRHALTSAR